MCFGGFEIFPLKIRHRGDLSQQLMCHSLVAHRATQLCHKDWRWLQECNAIAMQLNYWPCVIVNNTQSKYMQPATRLWVRIRLQPNISFTQTKYVFNLGIANGAKVGQWLSLGKLLIQPKFLSPHRSEKLHWNMLCANASSFLSKEMK